MLGREDELSARFSRANCSEMAWRLESADETDRASTSALPLRSDLTENVHDATSEFVLSVLAGIRAARSTGGNPLYTHRGQYINRFQNDELNRLPCPLACRLALWPQVVSSDAALKHDRMYS